MFEYVAPDRLGYDIPATAAIIAMNASTDRNLFVLPIVHPWWSIRRDRARRPPRLFRSLGGRAPLLFLSHVLPQTERIVCGTGVICLPQYHPAVTAGPIALFDHLAKGRYIAGIGPGGLAPDFELFGLMEADRNAMMVEAIDIMIDIWTSDPPYEFNGEHWQFGLKDWIDEERGSATWPSPIRSPIHRLPSRQ